MSTLTRRLITIPGYFLMFAVSLALLPLALPAAAVFDLVRGTPLAVSRAVLFFVWYLGCECAGLTLSFGLWIWGGVARPSREDWLHAHLLLKCWWARQLLGGGEIFFGMHVEVEGLECVDTGPYLLFMRHASVADTILTSAILSHRTGIDFRHVVKRELLWDPCLDVAGHRLPNYFVDRSGTDSAREIDGIRRLAEGMGPKDGVAIYPEGTRFTEPKRARILGKLQERGDREFLERARALSHVLPPRLGGPIGLLEAAPEADVLFCTHVGFDGIQDFRSFLRGGLVNQRITMTYWKVPAADVPDDRDARIDWLYEHWARIDVWVRDRSKPS